MTNEDILNTALTQSAIDLNCRAEDFLAQDNKLVLSKPNPKARKYLDLPFDCSLVSYGNNIVASIRPDILNTVSAYLEKYPAVHCFETPHLHVLNDSLSGFGLKICFMAEYFLPDMRHLKPLPCRYEIRFLSPADFAGLYLPEWSNALCEKRPHLDILAAGAYDHGKLIGLAGCSADCDTMWQIGIDVLPSYRRQGIAAALTASLSIAAIEREKVPFYCAAWSNIKSVRNAVKSGFRPAWAELTAKSSDFVDGMNRR